MEMGTAFVLNPYKQFAMLTLRADSPGLGVSAPEDPGYWDRVVQELNATQEQREQVSACWDLNSNILVSLFFFLSFPYLLSLNSVFSPLSA
jgi:hypothetical protein